MWKKSMTGGQLQNNEKGKKIKSLEGLQKVKRVKLSFPRLHCKLWMNWKRILISGKKTWEWKADLASNCSSQRMFVLKKWGYPAWQNMRERKRERERECVCVCVSVCVRQCWCSNPLISMRLWQACFCCECGHTLSNRLFFAATLWKVYFT